MKTRARRAPRVRRGSHMLVRVLAFRTSSMARTSRSHCGEIPPGSRAFAVARTTLGQVLIRAGKAREAIEQLELARAAFQDAGDGLVTIVVDGFLSRFGTRLAALFFGLAVLGSGCRGPAHPPAATQLVLTLRDYDTSRYHELSDALHELPGVYDMKVDAANMQLAVFVEPAVTFQALRTEAAKRGFHLEEGAGQGSYVTPAGWSQGSDIIFLNAAGEDFPNLPLSKAQYTVVEFTAEWCPGCHMLSNEIRRLLIARKDIAFRVVDIGNFGSPAHQHWCSTLRVLPYVVVYTPEGKMLAEHPGFRRGWVEKTIDEHARSAKGPRAAH